MKILELELLSDVRVPHNRVSRYRSHFSVDKGDTITLLTNPHAVKISLEGGAVYFPFHVIRCWRAEEGEVAEECAHEEGCPHSPKEEGEKVKRGPRRG